MLALEQRNNMLIGRPAEIVWLDEPSTAQLKIERKHVAILHPSFDIKTEWDRRLTRRS